MTAASPERRRALVLMLSAGLAPLLPQSGLASGPQDLASLGAVLDTLFPSDALCPSATKLGVDAKIRDALGSESPLLQLFTVALGWMDGLKDRPFRDLPPAQQAEIVEAMAASDFNQIPGRFYHIARALTLEFAYATPEALGGLPLHPAPQPEGYPP
ncbi:MAG: gluconate 2-dehydrogenase subunit 3 family protein [Cypionkella sp.]